MDNKWLRSTVMVLVAASACLAFVLVTAVVTSSVEAGPSFQFITPTSIPPTSAPPTDTPQPPPPTPPPNTPVPTTPGVATATSRPAPKPEKEGKSGGGALAVPSGPPPAKFKLNSCAKVVRPSGLDLFESPGFDSGYLQSIGVDQQVRVLGGPVGYDNLWWWQFRTPDGKNGWSVADYAEPSSGPCVVGGTVLNLGNLPLTGVGGGGLIVASVLVVVLIVAGALRRRRSGVK